MDDKKRVSIPEFFSGRYVLLTGATGFVGQVLLEKLLRACPKISGVYLLVRGKGDKTPKDRIQDNLEGVIFNKIKETNPRVLKKIVVLEGEVTEPDLGLSQENLDLVRENVNIIIHSAATVRFNETLGDAVKINVIGTQNVIAIARQLQNIAVVVHVSTAYAFCPQMKIDEIVYSVPYSYQKVIELVRTLDAKVIDKITPDIIGEWPNTYTFTKALAETLIAEAAVDIPVTIVRPSVVSSTWREPFPGWALTMFGPIGIMIGTSLGVVRTIRGYNNKLNIIPADVVANIIIGASWFFGSQRSRSKREMMVFNAVVEPEVETSLAKTSYDCLDTCLHYPSEKVYRYPGGSFKYSDFWHKAAQFYDHYIPAALLDAYNYVTGKKRRKTNLQKYKKIHAMFDALSYFFCRTWIFRKNNVLQLENMMSEKDRQVFFLDVRNLHLLTYWQLALLGVRKHVLKESYSSLPKARKRLMRLYLRSMMIKSFILLGTAYCFLAFCWNSSFPFFHHSSSNSTV